jgi:hypothetical protein
MINRDDWLSPAAFVARIDLDSQSLNVQSSNVTDMDREAFRQTLAVLIEIQLHSNAKPFKLPDNRYKPLLLAAEMEAIAQEATRRFAAPDSFRWQRVNEQRLPRRPPAIQGDLRNV